MPRNVIFSVGHVFPHSEIRYISYDSKASLIDADIILFTPRFGDYKLNVGSPEYQGKPNIASDDSFRLTSDTQHWNAEIQNALRDKKTIVIFLTAPMEVFVDTGERQYSGTGKNARTTRIVAPYTSYKAIPLDLGMITSVRGQAMRVVPQQEFLTPYWQTFGAYSSYEAIFNPKDSKPLILTRTGDRIVGALNQSMGGNLLLLPPLAEEAADQYLSTKRVSNKNDAKKANSLVRQEFWTRFFTSIIEIDKALRVNREKTPAPDWANGESFKTAIEKKLQNQIVEFDQKILEIQKERLEILRKIEEEGLLRALLYEKGKPLEVAILDALRLLGFVATPYKDAESEFDAVFSSSEGRFIGEIEGKDSSPINVDKLRQLEMNIQEEFQKQSTTDYAKGVLFGNAYRLEPPSERGDFFTPKCVSGASRSKVALVRTIDLFLVAKYLRESPDAHYSAMCRKAIFLAEGSIVRFPEIPQPPAS